MDLSYIDEYERLPCAELLKFLADNLTDEDRSSGRPPYPPSFFHGRVATVLSSTDSVALFGALFIVSVQVPLPFRRRGATRHPLKSYDHRR